MTLHTLIRAGLAGLAALAVAVLLIDPTLAQTAAPAAPGEGDRERCGERAPDQCDESAPVHSITRSARSRMDCGIFRPSPFAVF